MSQESYESFTQTFPSTELLCEMFGVKSYEDLFEQHFKEAARLVKRGALLAVFPSDVDISRAASSGELTVRRNWRGKEIPVLNKDAFRKNWDLFKIVRQQFHSAFVGSAMQQMRQQDHAPGWGGAPKPMYIVKNGLYGDAVLAYDHHTLPTDKVLERKLCGELIAALMQYPMYTDIWWEYKIENDSVWLQPKDLTDELKAEMQKCYDEERADSWLVTASFYPGWKPDKSKDPPDDWKPAAHIDIS